jgi:hypothetical protein
MIFILILILLAVLPSCVPLTIHYTSSSTSPPSPTTLVLPSVFATFGALPSHSIKLNASTLSIETCNLNKEEYRWKALIYTRNIGNDFFSDCCTYHKAASVTIARLAQEAGASLVVIGSVFEVFFFFTPQPLMHFRSFQVVGRLDSQTKSIYQ